MPKRNKENDLDDVNFMTKQELCKRWKIGERALEKRVANGKALAPFKSSGRAVLWARADIIAHEIENTPQPKPFKNKKRKPV